MNEHDTEPEDEQPKSGGEWVTVEEAPPPPSVELDVHGLDDPAA